MPPAGPDAAIVYYHLALRYKRIFPGTFELIPLGGTEQEPKPLPENRITAIHLGLIRDGGRWGERFAAFMQSRAAAQIYTSHGLVHRNDIPPLESE